MVARLGAAPSVSSSQARRIAVFLARDTENGGLCGHCSRDLPLDRRLLFVAELTGHGMVGCVGNAPTMARMELPLYRRRTISTCLTTRNGCGTWSRTTIEELMRLPWFSTFPPLKMGWTAEAMRRD